MRTLFLTLFLCAALLSCKGNTSSAPAPFSVTSSGSAAYVINGSNNPPLTLQIGQTYTFNLNVAGHPFFIMSVQGTNTANAFSTGVSGNGNTTGTLTFTVPSTAPTTLFYDSSADAAMTGTITITPASGGGGGW